MRRLWTLAVVAASCAPAAAPCTCPRWAPPAEVVDPYALRPAATPPADADADADAGCLVTEDVDLGDDDRPYL